MSGYPRLVGDIGGTHARFASIAHAGAGLTDFSSHDCASFTGLTELLRHRLAMSQGRAPTSCALGMATPVNGDLVRMTNLDWSFSIESVRRELGLSRLWVVNDLAALALGIPALTPADLHQIGGGAALVAANRAVIGVGTGLGVSGLMHRSGIWVPVTGEGGHATLAAETAVEDDVLRLLRRKFGHVSAERVLSGPGLLNLYRSMCQIRGETADDIDPAEITRRALVGDDDRAAEETVQCFLAWLGSAAGNIALTLGARGGIYLGGGIAPKMQRLFAGSMFRARFESKGRFAAYLAAVPTWIVAESSNAALHGAGRAPDLES